MSKKKRGNKKPKITVVPNAGKRPKILNAPPPFRGGHIAWRFSGVDKNGPFSWAALEDPAEYKAVIESLSDMEPMNEAELGKNGCHFIPVKDISKDAKNRLIELQLDDLDELYSFRVMGAVRVFGIHRTHYMRVLWYDPKHGVCPAPKKNT